jgi:hypothetical protein
MTTATYTPARDLRPGDRVLAKAGCVLEVTAARREGRAVLLDCRGEDGTVNYLKVGAARKVAVVSA